VVFHWQKTARDGNQEVPGILSNIICSATNFSQGEHRLQTRQQLVVQGQKSFEVRWHPFFFNPDAPKEGVNKIEMYNQKFGEQRVKQMIPMMTV